MVLTVNQWLRLVPKEEAGQEVRWSITAAGMRLWGGMLELVLHLSVGTLQSDPGLASLICLFHCSGIISREPV